MTSIQQSQSYTHKEPAKSRVSEFQGRMRLLGAPLSDADALAIFQYIDWNEDGDLQVEEIVRVINQLEDMAGEPEVDPLQLKQSSVS